MSIAVLKEQLAEAHTQIALMDQAHRQQAASWQKQLEDKAREMEELHDTLKNQPDPVRMQEKAISEATAMLRAENAEIQSQYDRIKGYADELERQAHRDKHEREAEIESLQSKIRRLQLENETLRRTAPPVPTVSKGGDEAQLHTLRGEIDAYERTLNETREALSAAEATQQKQTVELLQLRSNSETRIRELQNEISSMRRIQAEEQESAKRLQRRLESLTMQLKDARSQGTLTQSAMTEKYTKLREDFTAQGVSLSHAQEEARSARATVDSLHERLAEAERERIAAENRAKMLSLAPEPIQQDPEPSDTERTVRKHRDLLKEQLTSAQGEIAELRTRLQSYVSGDKLIHSELHKIQQLLSQEREEHALALVEQRSAFEKQSDELILQLSQTRGLLEAAEQRALETQQSAKARLLTLDQKAEAQKTEKDEQLRVAMVRLQQEEQKKRHYKRQAAELASRLKKTTEYLEETRRTADRANQDLMDRLTQMASKAAASSTVHPQGGLPGPDLTTIRNMVRGFFDDPLDSASGVL